MKKLQNDIYYVGVNDHQIDLFEGQYIVPNGMAYNSYLIEDELIAVLDTVDINFGQEWLKNIKEALNGRRPTYLIVQHMEPDHSANIFNFLKEYPDTYVIGNQKTFKMLEQFFHQDVKNFMVVNEGDILNLGHHILRFVFAPMVHWPEVMFTYDETSHTLFSADAFGKFGALDVDEEWACEARRYYFGIVGKYGVQVQNVLAKAAALNIEHIYPLHGPQLDDNLGYYLNLYNTWSSYQSESEGVAIFFTSVYGNTKKAVELLKEKLEAYHCPKVVLCDLAREDMAEAVEDCFRYPNIVLATTTYNSSIFPFMNTFIEHLVERNFQNKTVALIENGSWSPMAAKVMKDKLSKCKNLTFIEPAVKILSSMTAQNEVEIDNLAKNLCEEYLSLAEVKEKEFDPKALYNIGYGLYVVTSNDGKKDNGFIVNTVSQFTSNPYRVVVGIAKANYSHATIKTTKKMNVNVLTTDTPFDLIKQFGFVSGRDTDKFKGEEVLRSSNGLVVLKQHVNAYLSLEVEQYIDLDSHGMFICKVVESKIISSKETLTYAYYQKNIKPRREETKKKGYVCKVCGYVYEGDELPEDFICPLCKHPASDFEKIE